MSATLRDRYEDRSPALERFTFAQWLAMFAPVYRAQFDRNRGISPEVYSQLVQLEGQALEIEEVQAVCIAYASSARVFGRACGLLYVYVSPEGVCSYV